MNGKETFTHGDGVSLKEYFCSKINAIEEKMKLNFDLNKVALDKAEGKLDARLTLLNEFREALEDQRTNYITRNEHDFVLKAIDELKEEIYKRPTWITTFALMLISSILGLLVTHFLT